MRDRASLRAAVAPVQLRSGEQTAVELLAAGGEADPLPKFRLVAYTGGAMSLAGFYYPVVIDLAGCTAPRPDVPVLRAHDPDRIVGHTTAVEVTARRVAVTGLLSGVGPDAREVRATAANGYAWQVSVGCSAERLEFTEAGVTVTVNGRSFTGPLYVARQTTVREVSFVSLGADGATSAAVSASAGVPAVTFEQWLAARGFDPAALTDPQRTHLRASFDAEQRPPANPPPPPPAPADPVRAERERLTEVAELTAQFPDLQATAFREAWTVEQTRAASLQRLRASRPTGAGVPTSQTAAPGRQHLAAALLCRTGHIAAAERAYGAEVVGSLGRLRSATLADLAATALALDGRDVPHDRGAMVRAALSTGTMPAALGDAARVTLEAQYRDQPATWRAWCAVRPAADFKPHRTVRPSFLGELKQLPEGGDIEHGTYTAEDAIAWQVDTFAKQLQIDRRAIINDDLRAFDEVLPAFGRTAARGVSDLVYRRLLANPNGHFSVGNKNVLTGAGSALSVPAMTAAVRTLRTQRDGENQDLDIQPVTLLVPPELETPARQLLASEALARDGSDDQQPTGNPFAANKLALQVEPRLSNPRFTGHSATAWYLFAGPADVPGVVGFLEGRDAPIVEGFGLDHDINRLAYGYRVYHDYGFALGDHRAGVRAAGA